MQTACHDMPHDDGGARPPQCKRITKKKKKPNTTTGPRKENSKLPRFLSISLGTRFPLLRTHVTTILRLSRLVIYCRDRHLHPRNQRPEDISAIKRPLKYLGPDFVAIET